MQRIANGTQLAAAPAADGPSGTPGYFGRTSDGAPAPTRVGRDWLNSVQEELCSVIAAAAISLNAGVYNQLLSAIQSLIASGTSAFLSDTGTANTYVLTPAPVLGAYSAGYTAVFKAAHANTGTSTVNVSALGAKAIVHRDGTALQAGDIPAGSACRVVYDGAEFQLEDAIPTLATTTLEGLVQLATDAQAEARSATNVALTPSNLAALYAASLANPGYEKNASGIIRQWGEISISFNTGPVTVSLPIAFPNGALNALAVIQATSLATDFTAGIVQVVAITTTTIELFISPATSNAHSTVFTVLWEAAGW